MSKWRIIGLHLLAAQRDRKDRKEMGLAFGKRVKKARVMADYNQKTLADAVGITQASISQIESGKRVPNLLLIYRIANAVGTTVKFLLATASIKYVRDEEQIILKKIKGLPTYSLDKIIYYIDFIRYEEEKIKEN